MNYWLENPEKVKIWEMWNSNTSWFHGLKRHHQLELACLLENQHTINSQEHWASNHFMQKGSIKLVARAYRQLFETEIVNFQALLSPAGILDGKDRPVVAKTRITKTCAQSVAVADYNLCDEFFEEIFREITGDLRRNGGLQVKSLDELKEPPRWIVGGLEATSPFVKDECHYTIGIGYGTYKEARVFIDPRFPKDTLLVNNEVSDRYYYCPYIAVTPCESRFMTRYGKCLLTEEEYNSKPVHK